MEEEIIEDNEEEGEKCFNKKPKQTNISSFFKPKKVRKRKNQGHKPYDHKNFYDV